MAARKGRYMPDCPTDKLISKLGLRTVRKEDRPGTKWKNLASGEVYTLASVTSEGNLCFEERPGRCFARSYYTPIE